MQFSKLTLLLAVVWIGFPVPGAPAAEASVGTGVDSYVYGESRAALGQVEALVRGGDAETLKSVEDAMIRVIQNPSATPDGRAFACRVLRQVGTSQAVPILATVLDDSQLAHSARFALQGIAAPEAGQALVRALPDVEPDQRIGIIDVLGERREATAVPALATLLTSDPETAAAAMSALGRIGGSDAARALLQASPHPSLDALRQDALLQAAEHMHTSNPRAVQGIYGRLFSESESPQVQAAALRGLVLTDEEQAVDRLIKILTGSTSAIQQTARGLLGELKGDTVSRQMAGALPSVPADVKVVLLAAIEDRADTGTERAVLAQAASEDQAVRIRALATLGSVGTAASLPALLEALGSEERDTARASTTALISIPGEDTARALIRAYTAADSARQTALAPVLASRAQPEALSALLGVAKADDAAAASAAAKAIGKIGTAETVPPLVQLIRTPEAAGLRKDLSRALAEICNRAANPDAIADGLAGETARAEPAIQALLVPALGRLDSPASAAVLSRLLQSADAGVRDAALRSLAGWSGTEPVAALTRMAAKPQTPVEGVLAQRAILQILERTPGLTAEQKAAFLSPLLASGSTQSKGQALAALVALKDVSVLDVLEDHQDDPEIGKDVRAAIEQLSAGIHLLQVGAGETELHAQAATVHGSGAAYEPGDDRQCIGVWNSVDAWVSWDIYVPEPGTYQVAARQSMGADPGATYQVSLAGTSLDGTVKKTAGWGVFDDVGLGSVSIPKPGRYQVKVTPVKKSSAYVMNLRGVVLTRH